MREDSDRGLKLKPFIHPVVSIFCSFNPWFLICRILFHVSLLDHFLGMVDTTRAQTVDTEIMRHCAYSLPAVAFTLGRENWIYLKDLFETLVKDMQVR